MSEWNDSSFLLLSRPFVSTVCPGFQLVVWGSEPQQGVNPEGRGCKPSSWVPTSPLAPFSAPPLLHATGTHKSPNVTIAWEFFLYWPFKWYVLSANSLSLFSSRPVLKNLDLSFLKESHVISLWLEQRWRLNVEALDFPGGPVIKTRGFWYRVCVLFPVRNKSHMLLCSTAKNFGFNLKKKVEDLKSLPVNYVSESKRG